LPTQLTELRNAIRNAATVARTSDSKAESATAATAQRKFTLELRRICPHDLVVILWSAYAGSYSNDHDDQHDELRQCLRCGQTDSANPKGGHHFSLLKSEPIRRFELRNRKSDFDREPLEHDLLELVLDTMTRGYFPFTDEWHARQAIKHEAEAAESFYQRFKATHITRLTKELRNA
jgi:hypothetical protein